MTEVHASPPTPRRRRTVDARLLVGLVLVAASIAAVVGIVTVTDGGDDVLVAPRLLSPGEVVNADDFEIRRVSLGIDGHGYLRPADVPTAGLVITRLVGSGELVPLTAVGDSRGPSATTIVVTLSTPVGATVRPGDALDLWSAPALDAGQFGAPVVIASDAQLVRLVTDDAIVSTGQAGRIELLIARRDVARILHALANGDALSAVPVSLAIGG
ncbi:MAG: hypothetical protein RLZZ608_1098 [Actinomycetota bacterium]|jgi:hypothetical protein